MITTPRPTRSMFQIYTDASNAALSLAAKAESIHKVAKFITDKQICENHSFMANRFAAKAQRAAEKTLTMLNDGTLKEYCKEFDKVFEQFVKNAQEAEKELNAIEVDE